MKPRPILGSTLDFGLVLFIDFRADQRSGLLQFLHAFFKWSRALGSRGGGHARGAACRHLRAATGGRRPFQQGARGLQVLAQLVHLGARLGIFDAHLVHQTSELTHLILQVSNGAGSLTRCW